MKAIILVEKLQKAKEVFRNINVDSRLNDLLPISFYTKKDVLSNKSLFLNVEYIFSTWNMPLFTEEEIKLLFPKLRAVFYAAGSVKYFAEPFIRCGIRVFSAAIANGIPVAEYTVAQILLANKGFYLAQKKYKKPFYKISFNMARNFSESCNGNYKPSVGLIGFGVIGKKVAELLKPYDMNIFVVDPFIDEKVMNSLNVCPTSLEILFEKCDVISNHLPDIQDTKNLLDYKLFSKMKDNSTFINTARGAQVDEKGLLRALRENKSRTAVLDVTSHEPCFPWSGLLWNKNVFITPHIAGSLSLEELRLAEYMYQAYYDVVKNIDNICEVKNENFGRMA